MNQSFFFPQQFLHVFHRERERETAEYPCLLPSEIKEDTENKEVFFSPVVYSVVLLTYTVKRVSLARARAITSVAGMLMQRSKGPVAMTAGRVAVRSDTSRRAKSSFMTPRERRQPVRYIWQISLYNDDEQTLCHEIDRAKTGKDKKDYTTLTIYNK